MIHLIRINETNVRSKIKKLYLNTFPKFERLPFWFLIYQSKKKKSDFYAIYDEHDYVGLLFLTYYKDIVYVYYLAIEPSQQSKGYGSDILQYLKETYQDKRLLLNIEKVDKSADNYEQRLKRKNFYEKNGFKNTKFEIETKDIVYEILYSGEPVYEYEYHALFKSYFGRLFKFLL